MKEEFNLSEKIGVINNSNRIGLEIEDVKEFIRLLKELVKDYDEKDPREYMISAKFIREEIDTLAGEQLK